MSAAHPVPTDLCHALQQGQMCYVSRVTPTEQQSLCLHTRSEMELRGYRSSVIRLSALKARTHAQANWDSHLIKELWYTFYPTNRTRLSQWLNSVEQLSPRARLIQFSEDLLLGELCEAPITILIDTIDTLVGQPSAINDIFAWINHCYDLRDTYLSYHHLSFALFGQLDLSTLNLPLLSRTEIRPGVSQQKLRECRCFRELENLKQFHLARAPHPQSICSKYPPSPSRFNQILPLRITSAKLTYST